MIKVDKGSFINPAFLKVLDIRPRPQWLRGMGNSRISNNHSEKYGLRFYNLNRFWQRPVRDICNCLVKKLIEDEEKRRASLIVPWHASGPAPSPSLSESHSPPDYDCAEQDDAEAAAFTFPHQYAPVVLSDEQVMEELRDLANTSSAPYHMASGEKFAFTDCPFGVTGDMRHVIDFAGRNILPAAWKKMSDESRFSTTGAAYRRRILAELRNWGDKASKFSDPVEAARFILEGPDLKPAEGAHDQIRENLAVNTQWGAAKNLNLRLRFAKRPAPALDTVT